MLMSVVERYPLYGNFIFFHIISIFEIFFNFLNMVAPSLDKQLHSGTKICVRCSEVLVVKGSPLWTFHCRPEKLP